MRLRTNQQTVPPDRALVDGYAMRSAFSSISVMSMLRILTTMKRLQALSTAIGIQLKLRGTILADAEFIVILHKIVR